MSRSDFSAFGRHGSPLQTNIFPNMAENRTICRWNSHSAAAWGVLRRSLQADSYAGIPPTETFSTSGARPTLRGYDEDWFFWDRGVYTRNLWISISSSDPIHRFFVFTDLGFSHFDWKKPSVFRQNSESAYGFGARLESRGGILRINYGLAAGDFPPTREKIHVNLGAAFLGTPLFNLPSDEICYKNI